MKALQKMFSSVVVALALVASALSEGVGGGVAAAQSQSQPPSAGSPFDGQWVADVPLPGGGDPVRFTLLLMVEEDELRGTLQIGSSRPVPIENGRVRGGIISFQRTLGDGEATIRFLARVLDDGLHVGFMQRPAEDGAPAGGSSKVINFVAKRASARVHP